MKINSAHELSLMHVMGVMVDLIGHAILMMMVVCISPCVRSAGFAGLFFFHVSVFVVFPRHACDV